MFSQGFCSPIRFNFCTKLLERDWHWADGFIALWSHYDQVYPQTAHSLVKFHGIEANQSCIYIRVCVQYVSLPSTIKTYSRFVCSLSILIFIFLNLYLYLFSWFQFQFSLWNFLCPLQMLLRYKMSDKTNFHRSHWFNFERGVNHFNIFCTRFLIFQRDFWIRRTRFLISLGISRDF